MLYIYNQMENFIDKDINCKYIDRNTNCKKKLPDIDKLKT